jgi:hypothetical protein
MKTGYGIILVSAMAAVIMLSILPCSAQRTGEEKKEDIWRDDEPRGGPRGDPRGGPRRFELTDEIIERVMKELAESDPEKAKELAKLREKEPEKFKDELGKVMRKQFGERIREHYEERMRKWRAGFLEWLGKNYPPVAEKLANLKEQDPEHYIKAFDRVVEKYGYIYRKWLQNPELGRVLKEKLELKEKRDRLLRRIRASKSEKDKKKLITQLEEVVSSRFDLMVREKQIAYEQLLKSLAELKKRVEESQAEVDRLMDVEFKKENVKARVEELIRRIRKFKWD